MKIFKKNILLNNKFLFNKNINIFLLSIYLIFISFSSEIISRLSLINTLKYAKNSNFYFFINSLIILLIFLLFINIINNKYISLTLFTILVLFVSVITNIKVVYRGTGFTPLDFLISLEAGKMSSVISTYHIYKLLIYSILFVIVSYIFIIFISIPKIRITNRVKNLLVILIIFLPLVILTPKWCLVRSSYKEFNWQLKVNGNASNLGGFFYFISKINNSIDLKTPSKKTINETFPYISPFKNLYFEHNQTSPDIIYLQSESFYDVTNFLGIENFTEDPLPYYHDLLKESDHFNLSSPTRGGGTANAEFEIMTGIPTLFFPTDLSIFSGYLNQPTISIGSILRSQGYDSQIIHPFLAVFYRRHIVYNLFGFNSFISLDTMKKEDRDFKKEALPYDKMHYVSDSYLSNQIIKKLEEKKDKKNFIFAITMQGHIPFITNPEYENITYTGDFLKNTDQYEDFIKYIKILKDVDESLKIIINYLKKVKKPTILVFYADHQPFFHFPEIKDIKNRPYEHSIVPSFIWCNYKKLTPTDSLLDMTNLSEKVLSLTSLKIPNYYKILRNFRLIEKIQTINQDYIVVNNKIYYSNTEEYKKIKRKYQILASDILGKNKFIEGNSNFWLIKNNYEYDSPVPL